MVVVGGGPGHQREKRDKQQLAVLTALSRLALYGEMDAEEREEVKPDSVDDLK